MKFHKDGTQPRHGEVFVFGSNLAGRHGAGAAKAALKFGAKMGVGVGLSGMTYAIPTKDEYLRTLPLNIIELYVDRFNRFTLQYPEVEFFVTRVGCGLAGYTDKDIAPMFRGASGNCNFSEEWKRFVT